MESSADIPTQLESDEQLLERCWEVVYALTMEARAASDQHTREAVLDGEALCCELHWRFND